MTIRFYNSDAEKNRVDKTDYITLGGTVTGQEQPGQSVLHPIIIFELSSQPLYNYAYIQEYDRYYFISKKIWLGGNEWELHFDVDVLMTYRSYINNCHAFVERAEVATDASNLLPDPESFTTACPNITMVPFYNSELTTEEVKNGKAGVLYIAWLNNTTGGNNNA